MTRPWRLITLHLSHIFFTLGLTFIELSLTVRACQDADSCTRVDGWLMAGLVAG